MLLLYTEFQISVPHYSQLTARSLLYYQISTEKTQLTSARGNVNLKGQQSNYGRKKDTPHQVRRGKMVPLHKHFIDLEL